MRPYLQKRKKIQTKKEGNVHVSVCILVKSCSILGEQLITICFMNQGVEIVAHDLENGYQYRQKRKKKSTIRKKHNFKDFSVIRIHIRISR